jgi:hypothetical protein
MREWLASHAREANMRLVAALVEEIAYGVSC